MKTLNLNLTEQKVFNSLIKETQDCTGGEFGYIGDVDKCGLNKNEFAGYVSALKAKGIFDYLDTANGDYNGQFAIKKEYHK